MSTQHDQQSFAAHSGHNFLAEAIGLRSHFALAMFAYIYPPNGSNVVCCFLPTWIIWVFFPCVWSDSRQEGEIVYLDVVCYNEPPQPPTPG